MSTTPLQIPTWAQEIRARYESGEASQFLLHGNVADLFPFGSQHLWLSDFLTQALCGNKKIVAYYDISQGLRFANQEMAKDFRSMLEVFWSVGGRIPGLDSIQLYAERPDLIKDPRIALPILEKLIEQRDKVVLIVDHLDKIVPNSDLAFMSMDDRRNLATLQRWSVHPQLLRRDNAIILIARSLANVHRDLRSGNPLLQIVEISFPDFNERLEFIRQAAGANGVKLEMTPEQLADITAGLNLVSIQSFFQQAKKNGAPISFASVKKRKDEIFADEYGGLVEVLEPDFGLEMVAGMDKVKEDLRVVIKLLREGPRHEVPMGVGLIGPPGTGKTMLAKALAKEGDLPFLKIGDIRDKFVGESEKNAELVLTLLRSLAPVVVFVDEIDQAYGSRGEQGDSGVSKRIWAKFSEVQGDSRFRGRILWIWATNRPDIMDEATKRPGRLGDLKIPLFFAADAPEEVLRLSAKRHGIELRTGDLGPVLERTKGYSPAELEAVVLHARWFARRAGRKSVTRKDLLDAANDYIPSRNDRMIEFMEILAALEASSKRMLPEKYLSEYDREQLVTRAHQLRAALSLEGLL